MSYLLYQGHASFRIITESGLVFYIDPFKGAGYDVPADVILITHQHHDHNNIDIVTKKDDCIIITNAEALTDGEYNSFEIDDVLIEAVPAYNHHHKKEECVGYILSFEGRKLYFCGDTGITEEMKTFPEKKLDIIFVPIDGKYTMNIEEAKLCTELVQADYCIPIHTAPPGKDGEPSYDLELVTKFEGKKKVIVKPGENIVL